jgi:HEPN domain-containing protein
MFTDVNPKETEISCYHAEQCAEKSLKAYLILKDIDPPCIHDLLELNQLCAAQKLEFFDYSAILCASKPLWRSCPLSQ